MENCYKCGADLSGDETGLNYKLINRSVTRFLCIKCLSEEFGTSVSHLRETADRFRAAGCSMFPPKMPETEKDCPKR